MQFQQPLSIFWIRPVKNLKSNWFSHSEFALASCYQRPCGILPEILKSLLDLYSLCRSCLQLQNKTKPMKMTKGPLCLRWGLWSTTWQGQQVKPPEDKCWILYLSQALILTLSALIIIGLDSNGNSANILHFWLYCCEFTSSWRCPTTASAFTY